MSVSICTTYGNSGEIGERNFSPSEKIIAATESSHNATENVSPVTGFKEKSNSPLRKAMLGARDPKSTQWKAEGFYA
jgi:hypothetical protein